MHINIHIGAHLYICTFAQLCIIEGACTCECIHLYICTSRSPTFLPCSCASLTYLAVGGRSSDNRNAILINVNRNACHECKSFELHFLLLDWLLWASCRLVLWDSFVCLLVSLLVSTLLVGDRWLFDVWFFAGSDPRSAFSVQNAVIAMHSLKTHRNYS